MRFSRLFERFLSKGDEDKIDWDKIEPPPPGMVWLHIWLSVWPCLTRNSSAFR